MQLIKTVRLGGVPEHFNIPVNMAIEQNECENVDLKFETIKGGTGAMLSGLQNGTIDCCIALTECLIASIEKGSDICLLGSYVSSPLLWGISVRPDSPIKCIADLEGKTFGISRYGSGSHVMAFVLAYNNQWTIPPKFKVCNDFKKLRADVRSGEIDAFLWEHFTTKPYQDNGEVVIMDDIPTPWPCFAIACKREFAENNQTSLKVILEALEKMCVQFKTNEAVSLARVSSEFTLVPEDAKTWFDSVTYSSNGTNWSRQKLQKVRDYLIQAGVLESGSSDVSSYLFSPIATIDA